ncbi:MULTISPECIES: hypothetical protein [unclassified Rubrivivax]|uniref:hypothetical protein n=1 Tax=unclassified Rubrivivax TaxID=2649762 RepID=UPI001E48607D|nr:MULTISPECIES: hypothetical protein [unclassified Rubrivivax]MCC9597064.1 hypothetical protein [Rubrivivax sp. JA1055]MCC9646677.1 hypothetical protein [Rubrivivax sp. JA1029]
MHPVNTSRHLVALACLLALAACGGGSDGDDAAAADAAAVDALADSELAAASALLDTRSDALAWDAADAAPDADADADVDTQVSGDTAAARVTAAALRRPKAPAAPPPPATSATLSDAERIAAAKATAASTRNACAQARPFYWEIGNAAGRQVSGSVADAGTTAPKSTLPISIASASKWLYGGYVAQLRAGALTASDRKFLSMTSGYASLGSCSGLASVDACLASGSNGVYTPAYDGLFKYDGGHMEKHASLVGLGALTTKALATEFKAKLGSDIALSFSQPLMAGGAVISTDAYALFLRKILGGKLQMKSLLGSGPVCTNPATCASAVYAPLPLSESWHYSVGHWVEDDPKVGDGAFSSPGAFGFYPWIDATKTRYGIVARVAPNGALGSVNCGRLIRSAWASGVAQ